MPSPVFPKYEEVSNESPIGKLPKWTILGACNGPVEIWESHEDKHGAQPSDYAKDFIRDATENLIIRKQIPFWDDRNGCRPRVCRDIVIGVTKRVRIIENEERESDKEKNDCD